MDAVTWRCRSWCSSSRRGSGLASCTARERETSPYVAPLVEERFAECERLKGVVDGCLRLPPDGREHEAGHALPLRYSIDGKGYLLIRFPTLRLAREALFRARTFGQVPSSRIRSGSSRAARPAGGRRRMDARWLPDPGNRGISMKHRQACRTAFANELWECNRVHALTPTIRRMCI